MNLIQHLDYLFNPRSVAVIGASNIPGKWGCDILNLLLTRGERKVYPINRNRSEVLGVKAYGSIGEVPGSVDFAVITVSGEALPAAMEDCVRKGVKTALIITGGFSEVGGGGAEAEREVVEIARRGGIRFIGPNCAGHLNTSAELFTAPYLPSMREGPVSFVSQSGNLGLVVLAMGYEAGLGFSKYISSGNEADLHFEDYLEYLGQDEKTGVIIGYVEGFRESRRFLELAGEITRSKPVVIMKVGCTDCGATACRSHTAALSGSDDICDAAFRQAGVIRVDEVGDLVDTALVLLGQPLPRGRRVAVLTVGGGLGVVAADALVRHGLEVPPLSPATMERLNALLSGRWSRGNPVDTSGDISYPCLAPLLEDENVDAVLIAGPVWAPSGFSAFISTPPWERDNLADLEKMVRAVEEESVSNLDATMELMKRYQKPVVLSVWVDSRVKDGELYRKLWDNCLTPYPTPDKAAKALARLVEYSEYLGVATGS
ncbi:MAG TPA: acetyl-CoA synthetase [Dehalococcoidia bacterium]|nr:acetyl-CoA synthetase [Dehalococcoidia bacterium]